VTLPALVPKRIRPDRLVRGNASAVKRHPELTPALPRSECYRLNPLPQRRCCRRRSIFWAADGETDQHVDTKRIGGSDQGEIRSIRADRTSILDEFVAVTGYHRKHAIRLLSSVDEARVFRARRVARRYGADVREALIALWEASDRVCSKRLKPLVPVLLPALERHGRLVIDAALRTLLTQIRPASMDRLLSEVRRGGRRRRAGFSSAVRR
jgi:hypothetical protein